MLTTGRRYNIDWLRVIAIGLLLLYHTAIAFQPWGFLIGFITNDKPLESLWIPMTMLNVWRIPLLFFLSGMGVYLSCKNRNWKELLRERTGRIFVPFIFGIFAIVPLQIFAIQHYYHQPLHYTPVPAHLWFLGNIFVYILLVLPFLFFLKERQKNIIACRIKKVFSHPLGLITIVAAFILEVVLIKPVTYEFYAMTWHGFFLGLIAFTSGFCIMLGGTKWQTMLMKWKWPLLFIAVAFYIYRLMQPGMKVHDVQLVIESNCWIFSVLAFGYKYLNRPGKKLTYLSQAAYPVYIVHMLMLNLASLLIFPLEIGAQLKFVLVLLLTFTGSLSFYELLIRRINFLRILFGLKQKRVNNSAG